MQFKGSIIITDPCYICKNDDWEKCFDKDSLSPIGINQCIFEDTLYGDWDCTTFKTYDDPRAALDNYLNENCETSFVYGRFCADAGMVCVCHVYDVLKYNPKFFEEYGQWCYTIVPDFDGEIEYYVKNDEAYIIGTGNKNFFTCQTEA